MKGFKFAGIPAGIKKNKLKDLGLIFCEREASAAALFTKNKVVAAPVIIGKQTIKSGTIQAILVNSGNANCFTGKKGMEDALSCVKKLSLSLGIRENNILVSSTGVIGQPLPMEKFETGIPQVVEALSKEGLDDFAASILTTDLCTKIVERTGKIENIPFKITGIAKGSGMIRPDMATMLAFICIDVKISSGLLKRCLMTANEKSFSRISVDGDTSTNDTLFALANGASKVDIRDKESQKVFQKVLDEVCLELAKMIVRDGEGATKLIQINVKGARTKQDAFKVAETIAHSNLVKTAIYGEDPNWGRITAAAGRSGAQINPDTMALFFEDQALVKNGMWLGSEAEKKAAVLLKKKEIDITLDLNLGDESDHFIFCDFSENYVKINADYRS
ncbi:MAG: bifunctional glutamate N-acetyltransferase/amino-acid acetyltransferase ArgJ [Desulfobacula sp.]|nr:bifunctional glutamate N-acetyltransferase/amino-acid acetyltransferase ArgJ [Desulfobacula sp.]